MTPGRSCGSRKLHSRKRRSTDSHDRLLGAQTYRPYLQRQAVVKKEVYRDMIAGSYFVVAEVC